MSDVELGRLRSGEVIAGVSALLLLASMFALKWYAASEALSRTLAPLGRPTSWTGWSALNDLRWLLLVTILAALALALLQASRRPPAIPVTLSVIVTVLAGLSVVALIYRVLINPLGSGSFDQQPGAYLGLLAAIGTAYGGYRSMREESGSDLLAHGEIETLRIGPPTGS